MIGLVAPQVPSGVHWRDWYFGALSNATVLLFVLSSESLESSFCCDELFFARDNNVTSVYMLVDQACWLAGYYHPSAL